MIMPNSLRTMIKKLRYKGKITEDEYDVLILKLDGHDCDLMAHHYSRGFKDGSRAIFDEENKAIFYNDSTLKLRSGDYVLYKVDWLKEHFQQEMDILGVSENEET